MVLASSHDSYSVVPCRCVFNAPICGLVIHKAYCLCPLFCWYHNNMSESVQGPALVHIPFAAVCIACLTQAGMFEWRQCLQHIQFHVLQLIVAIW